MRTKLQSLREYNSEYVSQRSASSQELIESKLLPGESNSKERQNGLLGANKVKDGGQNDLAKTNGKAHNVSRSESIGRAAVHGRAPTQQSPAWTKSPYPEKTSGTPKSRAKPSNRTANKHIRK